MKVYVSLDAEVVVFVSEDIEIKVLVSIEDS